MCRPYVGGDPRVCPRHPTLYPLPPQRGGEDPQVGLEEDVLAGELQGKVNNYILTRSHLVVTIHCNLYWPWSLLLTLQFDLSRGIEFDPRLGYRIDDPEDFQHNGTYLCEFTDTGRGKKFSSLVIDLMVKAKKVTKTFVQVKSCFHVKR